MDMWEQAVCGFAASPWNNRHYSDAMMDTIVPQKHQPQDCLLNRLFRRRSKKTSKLRVTGLCAGKSPETGEFPALMAGNAETVSIWWRHHDARLLVVSYVAEFEERPMCWMCGGAGNT